MPKVSKVLSEKKVSQAVANLLKTLNFDLSHPDIIDTPKRVAKMFIEELEPDTDEDIAGLLRAFPSQHESIVVLKNHRCYTRCPHHMMPVEMDVSLAYVPNRQLMGLSKPLRITNFYSRGWMLQEEVASGIVDGIQNALSPLGVMVYINARHMCMHARGVRSTHSEVATIVASGLFQTDPTLRKDFMDVVLKGGNGK
jgi:GTP cyclohydrolase I